MNLKKWIAINVVLLALAAQGRAQSGPMETHDSQQGVATHHGTAADRGVTTREMRTTNHEELFSTQEFRLQVFGTYGSRDRTGNSRNGLGGGVGLTYFLTRYVGIGADTYIEEWKAPYRINGSLILRYPLPDRFSRVAVYGLGGGGRQFKDVAQYTWHLGGGLEYRVQPNLGIFADVRQVFPDKTPNYVLARAGLSFGF